MEIRGIRVKVKDVTSSYVSFRYMSSNASSRVKKDEFMKALTKGTYDVINPEILEVK